MQAHCPTNNCTSSSNHRNYHCIFISPVPSDSARLGWGLAVVVGLYRIVARLIRPYQLACISMWVLVRFRDYNPYTLNTVFLNTYSDD